MSAFFPAALPDRDVVSLAVMYGDRSVELNTWTQYSYNQHFLTPADGFTFSIAADRLSDIQKRVVRPGALVRLAINDVVQATGYIDKVHPHADRGSGAEWDIEGRDVLGQVVDATMDPLIQFKDGMTLADVADVVFSPFGFNIHVDNAANRDAIKGSLRGTKTSKKGKPLKDAGIKALKPHPKEGCFEFFARVAQRHGLMAWASNDGLNLIVSKPDFAQAPSGILQRITGGPNNIQSGGTAVDITDQPHLIVAEGFSGSPEYGKSRVRALMLNPAVGCIDTSPIDKVLEKYKDAAVIRNETFSEGWEKIMTVSPRILFLHDDESHTQEQVEYFLRREMSLRLRKVVDGKYTVEGHTLPDKTGVLGMIATDSIYTCNDEVSGVNEALWCLSRTFKKTRGSSGTTADLELIRPYSIDL